MPMLEKPDLQDERLVTCLQDEYGLIVSQVAFLPLGADQNTAVFRVLAEDGTPYFVKLRRGAFNQIAVVLPKCLSKQGIGQVIAPLSARNGQLWVHLEAFTLILYPFIEGRDGYEISLTDRQWIDFGKAIQRIHTAVLPQSLMDCIQRETYSPRGRGIVMKFLERIEVEAFDEPVAVKTAALLEAKRDEILNLVQRAEQLARTLQTRSMESVVCHSDLHAGNILINDNGAFYIVDWDDPILAPKERDLMFIGGGQGFIGRTALEEEALFYQGYGQNRIDPIALAYYRYERIIQDIAVFCEQLLLTDEGGEDREQSFQYLTSNFLPGGTIEIACKSDKALGYG